MFISSTSVCKNASTLPNHSCYELILSAVSPVHVWNHKQQPMRKYYWRKLNEMNGTHIKKFMIECLIEYKLDWLKMYCTFEWRRKWNIENNNQNRLQCVTQEKKTIATEINHKNANASPPHKRKLEFWKKWYSNLRIG